MTTPGLADRLFWPLVGLAALGLWFGRGMLALGAGLAVAAALLRIAGRGWRIARLRRRVRAIAGQHAGTLARRRRQETYLDAYDNVIRDGWERERRYFVERTVLPRLAAQGLDGLARARLPEVLALIEAAAGPQDDDPLADPPDDGIAYERYCAARLAEAGWRAHPTKASGDQGADVVAERAGTRLVVQCKRHTKPVGNGAVQEAVAARGYWSANLAAVVTNAGFTPAARRLAGATGVLLLHHDDLPALDPRRT
jgi:restriction system protein